MCCNLKINLMLNGKVVTREVENHEELTSTKKPKFHFTPLS